MTATSAAGSVAAEAVRPDVGRPRRVGRHAGTGGYRRFAWTARGRRRCASGSPARRRARGLDVVDDRAGNLWAWWRRPRTPTRPGRRPRQPPGLRARRRRLRRAARRGVGVRRARRAARPRVRPGPAARRRRASPTRRAPGSASPAPGRGCSPAALDPDRARALTDDDGVTMAEALTPRRAATRRASAATTRRCAGSARSSSCTSSRAAALDRRTAPSASAPAIWPHGRWRLDLRGRADHAGTTRLDDRRRPDARLRRRRPRGPRRRPSGTARSRRVGKVRVRAERRQRDPVAGHRLARRPRPARGRRPRRRRGGRRGVVEVHGGTVTEESWTRPHRLRRRRCATGSPRCSADAPPCCRRAPGTTPGSSRRPGSRRRCCSSATRPGSRTPPPSTPSAADCLAGRRRAAAVAADRGAAP